jgi:hypothetical protein
MFLFGAVLVMPFAAKLHQMSTTAIGRWDATFISSGSVGGKNAVTGTNKFCEC